MSILLILFWHFLINNTECYVESCFCILHLSKILVQQSFTFYQVNFLFKVTEVFFSCKINSLNYLVYSSNSRDSSSNNLASEYLPKNLAKFDMFVTHYYNKQTESFSQYLLPSEGLFIFLIGLFEFLIFFFILS